MAAGAGGRKAPSTVVLAAALCLIWALTFIAQRTALRESDPLWIAAGRTTIGALALAPALRVMDAAAWRAAAAIGLTSVAGFIGFQIVGLEAIGAGPVGGDRLHAAGAGGDRRAPVAGRAADPHPRGRRADRAGRRDGRERPRAVRRLAARGRGAVRQRRVVDGGDAAHARDARAARAPPGRRPAPAGRAAAGGRRGRQRALPAPERQARRDGPLRGSLRRGRRAAPVHDAAAPRRGLRDLRLDVQRADHRRRARGGAARRAAAPPARDRPRARQRRRAAGDAARRPGTPDPYRSPPAGSTIDVPSRRSP